MTDINDCLDQDEVSFLTKEQNFNLIKTFSLLAKFPDHFL